MARGIPSKVLRYFEAIPLFGSVSKQGIRSLVKAATEVDLPAGKSLVKEGDTGRELYVIVTGTARATTKGRRIRDMGPGDFFGELAFLSHDRRTATVTSTSDMRLMVLGAKEFESVVEREPKLALQVLAAAAVRLREFESRSI